MSGGRHSVKPLGFGECRRDSCFDCSLVKRPTCFVVIRMKKKKCKDWLIRKVIDDAEIFASQGRVNGTIVQQYISTQEKERRGKYLEMCNRKKSPVTHETVTVKDSHEFELHDAMSDTSSSRTRSTHSSISVEDEQQSSTEISKIPCHRSMSVDIKADSVADLAGRVSAMTRSMPYKNSSNLFNRSNQLKNLQDIKGQSIFGHITAGAFALKLPSVWPDSRKWSADQRRWAHVKPRDSSGRIIHPHNEIFSNQSVLPILKTIKPTYNLSRVWADYFEFLRTVRAGFVAGNNAKKARVNDVRFHEICESHRLLVCQKLTKLSQTCSDVTKDDKNYDLDKLILPPSHPNQLIGVDWKSLSAPACLPLTTDYFPDKTELRRGNYLSHENQVITERISPNEYLSDDNFYEKGFQLCVREACDLQSSLSKSPTPPVSATPSHKLSANGTSGVGSSAVDSPKKMTLDRKRFIYSHIRQHTQLASSSSQEQNLSGSSTPYTQLSLTNSKGGFSLGITFAIPKGIGLPSSHNCMFSISSSSKYASASLNQIWSARMDQVKKDLSIFTDSDGRQRVKLSVGRLFHELALDVNSDAISVKKYELNQDKRTLAASYSYYLQAPDSCSYSPLTVEFTNRNLAAFNWSYLDNYVCQRGLSKSYPLSPMLKYWRSRFVLLPIKSSVTKQLFEQVKEEMNLPGSKLSKLRFDVYGGDCNETDPKDKSCKKFMEFLEAVNRIRKVSVGPRKFPSQQPQHFTFNNLDTVLAKPGSNPDAKLCAETSPLGRIAHAMIELDSGFSFISHNGPAVLPRLTFISFYAVQWAKNSIHGVNDTASAVDLFQRLIEEGWICHSSGNPAHKFIHGFFFYTLLLSESLLDPNNEDVPCSPSWNGSLGDANRPCQFPPKFLPKNPSCQNESLAACTTRFQSEFIEVAIPFSAINEPQPASKEINCATAFEQFGLRNDSYNLDSRDGVLCKHCLCELENESDWPRVEWARYVYNANYHPKCAFSFELQWLVATGVILSETLNKWCRHASKADFHFFPAPCYPFGQPTTANFAADPLRLPIFVPLHLGRSSKEPQPISLSCLDSVFPVGSELDHRSKLCLIRQFQDLILKQFGFIFDVYDFSQLKFIDTDFSAGKVHEKNLILSRKMSYVHCSGGMFSLIPSYEQEEENITAQLEVVRNPADIRSATPSQHKAFFGKRGATKLGLTGIYPCEASLLTEEPTDSEICIGFYWAWNHQLPKKWRGQFTGDDMFQDRILEDFRRFCSAKDDRLTSLFQQFLKRSS